MDMNLKDQFNTLISGYLKVEDVLVVAVSGGIDSIVLLSLLFNAGYNNLVVAHFDHGLRATSGEDYKFVKKLAEGYGLEFKGTKIKVSKQGSIEANARKLRYDFLEDLRREYDAKYILTAHHKNDQAETIMMNLARGCFIKGMAGMNIVCDRKNVFRPLLSFNKDSLIKYASEAGLEFCVDETNAENDFDRNFVRNEIFPLIEQRFDAAQDRIADTACMYREMVNYCDSQVDSWIDLNGEKLEWGTKIGKETFAVLPNFMKFFTLTELLGAEFSQADFGEVLKLVTEARSGSHRRVSNMFVYVSSDHFLISEFSIDEISGLMFGLRLKNIELGRHRSIRTFKDGDKYNDKKLKEYFVNNKVPWYLRLGVPLVVDDEDNVIEVFD